MDNLFDLQTVSCETDSLSKVKYKILVSSFMSKKVRYIPLICRPFFFLGGGGGGRVGGGKKRVTFQTNH